MGGKSSKSGQQGKEHSGKRFAASKHGAGGDVKGMSKVNLYSILISRQFANFVRSLSSKDWSSCNFHLGL